MAHPKRIQILRTLSEGERTVTDLARLTRIPQSNVSQHLALLRQFGLLNKRRHGNSIYYSIGDKRVVEACELVRSCIADRLKSQIVLTIRP